MTLFRHKAKSVREIDHVKTGASFAKQRKAAGVTQRQIAKKLGVTPASVCQMEKAMQNRKWTEESAKAYAKALFDLLPY